MPREYAHKLQEPVSQYIKYQGVTGRIDVKDTIINIISKKPGLTHLEIFALIYPSHFNRSKVMVKEVLGNMVLEQILIESEGDYYLWDDAYSHDVAKTKNTIDELLKLGIDPAKAQWLAEGVTMALDERSKEAMHNVAAIHDELEDNSVANAMEAIGTIEFEKLKASTLSELKLEESHKEMIKEIEAHNEREGNIPQPISAHEDHFMHGEREANKTVEAIKAKRSLFERFKDWFNS